MDDQKIQQLIENLTPFFDGKMKENAYMVANHTNKEHSRFIGELRIQNTEILGAMEFLKDAAIRTNEHLERLNGSVAKHEQRLNNQDIMNAQTTISQQQTAVSLNKLVTSDEKNTTDRIGRSANMTALKWILGFVGFGTFTLVAKYIFNAF